MKFEWKFGNEILMGTLLLEIFKVFLSSTSFPEMFRSFFQVFLKFNFNHSSSFSHNFLQVFSIFSLNLTCFFELFLSFPHCLLKIFLSFLNNFISSLKHPNLYFIKSPENLSRNFSEIPLGFFNYSSKSNKYSIYLTIENPTTLKNSRYQNSIFHNERICKAHIVKKNSNAEQTIHFDQPSLPSVSIHKS